MAGPQPRKFSAKKGLRPVKPAHQPAEAQQAGRVIGFEGGEIPVSGKSKSKRAPTSRPAGTGSGRRPRGVGRIGNPSYGKSRLRGKPRRPRSQATPGGERPAGDRLQKILAAAGLGSRRRCEELITTGRVEVDRKVVTQLGTRVDTATQDIRVDGETMSLGRRVYYAVNKPKGVVSTNHDPGRRPRVIDLVPNQDIRLFAIGRLDLNSEGLILVTNDGELANRLTHPRYGVQKVYLAQVVGRPEREVLDKLRRGVHLAEGVAKVEDVRVESHQKDSTWLEIILREGMNREIRRLLARVGHKVLRLVRVSVGPVRLGKLPPGTVRPLLQEEVHALKSLVKNSE